MNKSLNLPNCNNRDWNQAEQNGLNDLAPGELVVIAYDVPTEQKYNHRAVLQAYAAKHPQTRFRIRCYGESIIGIPVRNWVAECVRRYRWWSLPNSSVIPGNETNLAIERGGSSTDPNIDDWGNQATWYVSIAGVFQELAPDILIEAPALSPSGGYLDGWKMFATSEAFINFDIIDAHVYDMAHVAQLANIPRLSGQPLVITEFNRILPETLFAAVDGVADSASWFLLGGTADQAQYDILKQPATYASFKNWKPGGQPMPGDPQIQQLLDQNAAITNALIALREGRWTGAGSFDGEIAVLRGGKLPDGYKPIFPAPPLA